MKRLNSLLIVAFVALSVVSCKKDDDGATEIAFTNANLAGVYNLTYYSSTEVETQEINGFDVVTTYQEDGSTFQMQLTFAENGTVTLDGQYVVNYSVDVNGQVQDEDVEIIDIDTESSTYSTTASPKLLILDGGTYEVELFNGTELRIRLEESSTSGGITTVYEEEFRMVKN